MLEKFWHPGKVFPPLQCYVDTNYQKCHLIQVMALSSWPALPCPSSGLVPLPLHFQPIWVLVLSQDRDLQLLLTTPDIIQSSSESNAQPFYSWGNDDVKHQILPVL